MIDAPWWRDALVGSPLTEEDGRVFFVETPGDAFTDTQEDVPRHRWSRMRRSHFHWLEAELGHLPEGSRLVDIGCGQSQFRELVAVHRACGIDFFPYSGANVVADLNRPLPLASGSCDAAVLSNVLEHIYEPRALLAETARILRPGGRMFVVVPFFIKIHQPPYDFFRYTNFALERMSREAGFGSVRVDSIGNVMDTFTLDRIVRGRILRREVSGMKRSLMRGLLWGERICGTLAERIAPEGLMDAPDRDGFPHSFAVLAEK
jgi:SAM-dependent methyltransferase